MSKSAMLMMIIGCGTVWGGVLIAIVIALAIKKENL
ncbi:hypothetical protein CLTEP_20410 [Clostridium tepidiprofundi DSM 19306]|uniref:MetS family NSS transporter small subunit n=1 Tax=Clostridium tepidiprofundi DSM 19306 TaxID=1121338 RepID=A0A151B2L9_9CLOT|nr:MetS family NSS transporter small subunit [Clostridium tepidiprofundi]KYH34040.1 hypothetical protein CLTEP_20410 [Clostridium tepidiprofundi DSM 19306]